MLSLTAASSAFSSAFSSAAISDPSLHLGRMCFECGCIGAIRELPQFDHLPHQHQLKPQPAIVGALQWLLVVSGLHCNPNSCCTTVTIVASYAATAH